MNKFQILTGAPQTKPWLYGVKFGLDMFDNDTVSAKEHYIFWLFQLFGEGAKAGTHIESKWYIVWNEIWFQDEETRLLFLMRFS